MHIDNVNEYVLDLIRNSAKVLKCKSEDKLQLLVQCVNGVEFVSAQEKSLKILSRQTRTARAHLLLLKE